MAKEELFEISRLLNWAWRHVGVVCVRRGKGDATVVENTVREVREGRGALVFPEGTRTKDGNLGKLKSGAFVIAAEAGVDMIPCRIIYKGGKMRVFGRCTVVFGKPIPAEKLSWASRAAPPACANARRCWRKSWKSCWRKTGNTYKSVKEKVRCLRRPFSKEL